MRKIVKSLLVICTFAAIGTPSFGVADGWVVTQVSHSGYIYYNDVRPEISGTNIVWTEFVSGKQQVMLWDEISQKQISSGAGDCTNPQISGSNVAWRENSQIMFYNGTSTTQISGGAHECLWPKISGSNVTWQEVIGGKEQIMFYNGAITTQVSIGANKCVNPQISGSRVVWGEVIGANVVIMLWNGTTPTQISNPANYSNHPQISGSNVVWPESMGQQGDQIMFYNGTSTTQISSGGVNTNCTNPQISGSNIAWQQYFNGKDQIMFWNGSAPVQLTNNMKDKDYLSISDSNVVWYENVSSLPLYDLRFIMFSDGSDTTTLADMRGCIYPAVSGTNVVFLALDENSNWQVFLAQQGVAQAKYAGDINHDGRVDFSDFAILASDWMQSGIVED